MEECDEWWLTFSEANTVTSEYIQRRLLIHIQRQVKHFWQEFTWKKKKKENGKQLNFRVLRILSCIKYAKNNFQFTGIEAVSNFIHLVQRADI